MASGSVGNPCGACRFLRRKCAADCVFAPYFCPEQGPEMFASIHRVFGTSNVSKLLLSLPVCDRGDAVVTIGYEAQARLRDPVYGCVAHVYTLQQQVASLQAQVMQMRAQLAHNNMIQGNKLKSEQWSGTSNMKTSSSSIRVPRKLHGDSDTCYINSSISSQSSIESTTDNISMGIQECAKRQRTSDCFEYWRELQELALRMME